jgi:hypothetical protein
MAAAGNRSAAMDRAREPAKRLARPSGDPPPERVTLADGTEHDLGPLAREVADRFLAAFPDELERYSDPAMVRAWCEHDTRHLVSWAVLDVQGYRSLTEQLDWLGRVLESRGYPIERLAGDLEIAADVVPARLGPSARPVAEALAAGAAHVRGTDTFLD